MPHNSAQVGLACKLYYNSGTHGSPTWNEISVARDVTLDLQYGEADASARIASVEMVLQALLKIELEYEIIRDNSNPVYSALENDFMTRALVDMAVADGSITATGVTEYFRFDTVMLQFKESQPLTESVKMSVKHKPTYSLNAPAFVQL